MTELRVMMPGVQILFAFMLSIPFSNKFDAASALQRFVYFVGFASCAVSSALLMAPAVYHRLHWRILGRPPPHKIAPLNPLPEPGGAFLAPPTESPALALSHSLVSQLSPVGH